MAPPLDPVRARATSNDRHGLRAAAVAAASCFAAAAIASRFAAAPAAAVVHAAHLGLRSGRRGAAHGHDGSAGHRAGARFAGARLGARRERRRARARRRDHHHRAALDLRGAARRVAGTRVRGRSRSARIRSSGADHQRNAARRIRRARRATCTAGDPVGRALLPAGAGGRWPRRPQRSDRADGAGTQAGGGGCSARARDRRRGATRGTARAVACIACVVGGRRRRARLRREPARSRVPRSAVADTRQWAVGALRRARHVPRGCARPAHDRRFANAEPRALRERADVYPNTVANASWTLPGHASLFTGRYLAHHRTDFTTEPGFAPRLAADIPTAAELFAAAAGPPRASRRTESSTRASGLARGCQRYQNPGTTLWLQGADRARLADLAGDSTRAPARCTSCCCETIRHQRERERRRDRRRRAA